MPTTKDWVMIAGMLLALALVGNMDAQDAERSQSTYCEMVALWGSDAAQDVAPEQRRGWPPYDGRKQCEN